MQVESSLTLPVGVSQRQVAEKVGVSVATVSRVLSGHERVSQRTKAHVEQAIREMDSKLDQARLEQRPVQRVIGLTLSNSAYASPGFPVGESLQIVLAGAEIDALNRGFSVHTIANPALLVDGANEGVRASIGGVILVGGNIDFSFVNILRDRNLPVVLAGGHIPGSDICSVSGDAMHGITLAVEHLVGHGHRRIALVNGPSNTYTSFEKRAGFLSALISAGLDIRRDYLRGEKEDMEFGELDGYREATALLALSEPPTAIVFASDTLALGGRNACQQHGLRIPEDVSIVGYDDSQAAYLSVPQLSSIRVDRTLWGQFAAERLMAILDGESEKGGRFLLTPALVVRDSSGPAPQA